MRRLVAITCLLSFFPGCQESSRDTPSFYYDGWVVTDGIVIPDSLPQDAGLEPDGLKYNTNGPKIEIIVPQKEPAYVVGKTMTVTARITDPDGVQAQSITANVKGIKPTKMSLSTKVDIFEAKIDVSSMPLNNWLWVVATDSKGYTNTSLIPFRRDPGPLITFLAPKKDERAKSSVSVTAVVDYQVEVLDNEKLVVNVGNTEIPMKRKSHDKTKKKQIWTGTVVFASFNPPLSGNQMLTGTMKNKNKTVGSAYRTFFVDNKGPEFTNVSHVAGQLIGGTIKIYVDLKDDAGLLDSSVKCVLGKGYAQRIVDLTPTTTKGRYEALFDARLLGVHDLYVVMDFLASDKLGNESHKGVTVILDNGPPVMEMDPPANMHMSKKEKGDVFCSYPFDPVGNDAINDLYQVPQISFMRARIEDQGNLVFSSNYQWLSGLDSKKVFLYVLDDTTQPLVVDSDEDGICDSINPKVIPLGSKPGPKQAVSVHMQGILPSGSADFYNKGSYLPKWGCSKWGADTTAPEEALCKGVKALVVPPARCVTSSTTAIFTIPHVKTGPTAFNCMGLPFDFLANKFDGAGPQGGNKGPALRL